VYIVTEQYFKKIVLMKKKSKICFGVSNKVLIFAPVKTKKDNENNVHKYILVVAPVDTPTVVGSSARMYICDI
jgi:hypothetical protein